MDILLSWIRAQWDRVSGALAMMAGAAALVLGWIGVAHATLPAEQLPYIVSGGIGGLYLLGLGATLWLSADLRDEWRHLDQLEQRIQARLSDHCDEGPADGGYPTDRAVPIDERRRSA